MEKDNYTKNNAEIMVKWGSDLKEFLFTFPLNKDTVSELLKRISVPLVFVLVLHFLGGQRQFYFYWSLFCYIK